MLTSWSGWHRRAGSSQTCPPPSWVDPDHWTTCGDKHPDLLNLKHKLSLTKKMRPVFQIFPHNTGAKARITVAALIKKKKKHWYVLSHSGNNDVFFSGQGLYQSYLIKQDSLLPPARECRSSHVLNVNCRSASCSVLSEDLYLHTYTHTHTPRLKTNL